MPYFDDLAWFRLYALLRLLEPDKVPTKMLEAEKTITGSLTLQAMSRLPARMDLLRFRDPLLQEFKDTMKECMAHEQDDPNWLLACGIMLQLDPTKCQLSDSILVSYYWKGDRFQKIREKYPTNASWIEDVHAACLEELQSIGNRQSEEPPPNTEDVMQENPMVPSSDGDWLTIANDDLPGSSHNESLAEEYNRYSATRSRPLTQNAKKLSTEEWWIRNLGSFPSVAVLAGEYLCIPSSSASVERMFSSNGHTLNKRRRLMPSEKVHQLTLVRDNMHMVPETV